MDNIVRSDLLNFKSYSSARDEAKSEENNGKNRVWLNANESPYDVELSNKTKINRYPDKQNSVLKNNVAELFHVKPEQLLISRGSDEAIDLLVRLCCEAGKDNILMCPPTYGMYSVSAKLQNAGIIQIPLLKENNFQLDMDAILASQNRNIKIIFICSPNNPTGNLMSKTDILKICEVYSGKSLVVVDEAYIDYADTASMAEYIDQYKNLVILRTFSKAYGLAGARIGFLIANAEIIQWMLKIIAPYPLSAVITQYVLECLSSKRLDEVCSQVQTTKDQRQILFESLKKLSWVKKTWPSEANYLLIETNNAQDIMRFCADAGVVIREMFDKPGLDHAVRITVGTPEQNQLLLSILGKIGA